MTAVEKSAAMPRPLCCYCEGFLRKQLAKASRAGVSRDLILDLRFHAAI